MAMTKAGLSQQVYQNHDFTKEQAVEIVEAFLRIAKNCLKDGDDLLLSGFGKFHVKRKKARRGRNPHNGETLILPPRKVVTFKSSGVLRDRVNGG